MSFFKKFFFTGELPNVRDVLNRFIDEFDTAWDTLQTEVATGASKLISVSDGSGGAIGSGDLVYKNANGSMLLATASAFASKAHGICVSVEGRTVNYIVAREEIRTNLKIASSPSIGDILFMSTTPGKATTNPPSDAGEIQQVVGIVSKVLTNERVLSILNIDYSPETLE